MTVTFEYRISGRTENATGTVIGSGKDYNAAMDDAYNNICEQLHNHYLTITFKKVN